MSDTKPDDRAARLSKIEKTSEKAGYWAVRIGLPLVQIAIAFELVQIVEGDFQTIVICAFGLIYTGIRAMSADAAISYYSGYLTTYTSTHLAIYLTSEPEREMEEKIEEMMAGLEKMNPDPHRKFRTIEFAILKIIFVVPLLKIFFTHLTA